MSGTGSRLVERALDRAARIGASLASLALVGMMVLTVADVVLRAAFALPIRGTFELVELAFAVTFFLALPIVFLSDENVIVDTIDHRRPGLVPVLRRVAAAVSAAVVGLMAWQATIGARDAVAFGDVTPDLALVQTLYWAPVLLGLAGAAITALWRVATGRGSR